MEPGFDLVGGAVREAEDGLGDPGRFQPGQVPRIGPDAERRDLRFAGATRFVPDLAQPPRFVLSVSPGVVSQPSADFAIQRNVFSVPPPTITGMRA